MPACGNVASRSCAEAPSASSAASVSASRTRRAPGSVLAVSSTMSAGDQSDLDRHAVGHHVEHGRPGLGALDDLAQLLLRRVALDLEADADPGEAVAHLVGETERAADVHVALQRGLDLGEAHL